MNFNDAILGSFMDELSSIQKEAGMSSLLAPLSRAVGGAFRGGWKGIQNIGRAATGVTASRAGQAVAIKGSRGHLARAGLERLAHEGVKAAILSAAGLGAYGAKKALFD